MQTAPVPLSRHLRVHDVGFEHPLKGSLDRYFTYVNLTKSIDLTPIEVRTSGNLRYVTTHIEMDTLWPTSRLLLT